jgi:hypothetical protein
MPITLPSASSTGATSFLLGGGAGLEEDGEGPLAVLDVVAAERPGQAVCVAVRVEPAVLAGHP